MKKKIVCVSKLAYEILYYLSELLQRKKQQH